MTQLDSATEFLIRKDKKALQRRLRKNEKTITVVQAKLDGRVGLLAATNTRLLFVFKRGLRYRHSQVAKADVAGISQRGGRLGAVHVTSKAGPKYLFEMLQQGAAAVFMEKVAPTPPIKTAKSTQVRKDGPMTFTPKAVPKPLPEQKPATQIRPHPRQQSAHDPLTATKADKLARLERLHEKGMLSSGEYRWQKDALERSR